MHIVEMLQLLPFFKNKTQECYLKSTYITHTIKPFSLDTLFRTLLAFTELSDTFPRF